MTKDEKIEDVIRKLVNIINDYYELVGDTMAITNKKLNISNLVAVRISAVKYKDGDYNASTWKYELDQLVVLGAIDTVQFASSRTLNDYAVMVEISYKFSAKYEEMFQRQLAATML